MASPIHSTTKPERFRAKASPTSRRSAPRFTAPASDRALRSHSPIPDLECMGPATLLLGCNGGEVAPQMTQQEWPLLIPGRYRRGAAGALTREPLEVARPPILRWWIATPEAGSQD